MDTTGNEWSVILMQQTTREGARRRPAGALNMPRQAPPVDRTEAAAAGASNAAPGIEASIIAPPLLDWDTPWTGKGFYPRNPYIVY
ncbi:hypothetical protein ABTX77_41695 [Streptomyces sp. NPDC097704]|uniref:hypothetical protein n=1 Tax=Streptomyces sp. NPDC097704 TaxID=3157101 RepID=UPI0033277464